MVFLDGNGRIETVGDFITDKDGMLYSNTSYKARLSTTIGIFGKDYSLPMV